MQAKKINETHYPAELAGLFFKTLYSEPFV